MRNYSNIEELLPWVSSLPVEDRITLDRELELVLSASNKSGDYSDFGLLLNQWKDHSDILSDPEIMKSMSEPLEWFDED